MYRGATVWSFKGGFGTSCSTWVHARESRPHTAELFCGSFAFPVQRLLCLGATIRCISGFILVLLRRTTVYRTYDAHKKLYIYLVLLTISGPIYYDQPPALATSSGAAIVEEQLRGNTNTPCWTVS